MASTFDDALYWYTKSEDHFILEGKLIQTLLAVMVEGKSLMCLGVHVGAILSLFQNRH